MPFMDGAAAIAALRKLDPAIKIIAMSGRVSSIKGLVSSEDVESDAHAFLQKPFSAEQLLAILDKVIAAR
ncbi:MAG: hypothetical protein HY360_03000 [Verrucomicrobia bacterium]|nr:hypothetical protein [Verrucomicrobiota bacterium]